MRYFLVGIQKKKQIYLIFLEIDGGFVQIFKLIVVVLVVNELQGRLPMMPRGYF